MPAASAVCVLQDIEERVVILLSLVGVLDGAGCRASGLYAHIGAVAAWNSTKAWVHAICTDSVRMFKGVLGLGSSRVYRYNICTRILVLLST